MYCSNCGTILLGKEKFCPSCGRKIEHDVNDVINDGENDDDALKYIGIPLNTCNQIDMYLAKGQKEEALKLYMQTTGSSFEDAESFVAGHHIGYWPIEDGTTHHIEELYSKGSQNVVMVKSGRASGTDSQPDGDIVPPCSQEQIVTAKADTSKMASKKKTSLYDRWQFWLLLAGAVVLIVLLFGKVTNPNLGLETAEVIDPIDINYNGCNIRLVDVKVEGDSNPVLYLYYQFENNSNKDITRSFDSEVDQYAYQDGASLDRAYFSGKDSDTFIKSGASITVRTGFYLRNRKSPVEVTMKTDSLLFSENLATMTISFGPSGNKPAGKQETGAEKDILDEIYNDGTIGFTYNNKFAIEYVDHEFAENTFGAKCVVVYFEFKNLSGTDQKYNDMVDVNAYQDGVKLDSPVFSAQSRKTENYSEIRNGTEVEVCEDFILRDDSTSDIEITVALNSSSKIIDHMFIPYEKIKDTEEGTKNSSVKSESGTNTSAQSQEPLIDKATEDRVASSVAGGINDFVSGALDELG